MNARPPTSTSTIATNRRVFVQVLHLNHASSRRGAVGICVPTSVAVAHGVVNARFLSRSAAVAARALNCSSSSSRVTPAPALLTAKFQRGLRGPPAV